MKKLVAVVLTVVLALGTMVGCGSGSNSDANANRDTVSKIAVLLPGSITDESWNQTAYEGLKQIEAKGEFETAYTENVGSNDVETVFRNYCEEGFDFVIGHGAQ